MRAFERGISIDSISDFTGSQHITANNDKYLRFHWEVNHYKIGIGNKWVYYAKGGDYRKWYGNIELIVDWSTEALQYYKNNSTSNLLAEKYRFKEGITYTELTSNINTFRYLPPICVFDKKGPSIVNVKHLWYCLGVLGTKISPLYFSLLNPTLSTQVRDVKNFPIILSKIKEDDVERNVIKNVELCKKDWDSFETSWDFERHPLINGEKTLAKAFEKWEQDCEQRFNTLKANEEELNRIFIEIYGLQDELTPEVEDRDVTVRKADLTRDIKSFISYAVGCMFGRYSLDNDGLAYAGGEWDANKYKTIIPVKDNVLPICDDDYLESDLTGKIVEFVGKVYGEETLEENLKFIARALGTKGDTPREVIRNYLLNGFYADHCKIYQKRPIYWLFNSGKKHGFKALVYMHRWEKTTVATVRTDYVHELQERYRTQLSMLGEQMEQAVQSESVKFKKRQEKLTAQLEEINTYEEKVHHIADSMIDIDLDDGVKVNYAKFADILEKIK